MNETLQETPDHNPDGDLGPQLPVATVQAPALPATTTQPSVTPAQARVEAVAECLAEGYKNASRLVVTPEEAKALAEDFPDEAFSLGAGGDPNLLYIEHAYLRQRLNQVLGVGAATPIRRKEWAEEFQYWDKDSKSQKTAARVYADLVLLVRGCVVGEAVGESVYYPKNARSNYGDALEGAMSNAFRRCCKQFGVGLQAWMKGWAEGWKQRHHAAQRPQAAPRPSPAVQTPPAKQNAPTSPTARPAVPVEATEEQKARWLKALEPVQGAALEWYIHNGALLDTEDLADLPLKFVPTGKHQADKTLAAIEAFTRKESIPPNVSGNQATPEDESWREFVMPFGKNKGETLGEMDKKILFGWWANYEVKDVDENGKPRKPEWIESDQELRDALDAAGEHYQFKA